MALIHSATSCCSCDTMVSIHGLGGLGSLHLPRKKIGKLDFNNIGVKMYKNGVRNSRASCFLFSGYSKDFVSLCVGKIMPLYETGLKKLRQSTPTRYPLAVIDVSPYSETDTSISIDDSPGVSFHVPESYTNVVTESAVSSDGVAKSLPPLPDSVKTDSLSVAQDFLNSKLESISLSVETSLEDGNKVVNNFIHDIRLFFNNSGESFGNKLIGLGTEFKETSGRAEFAALNVLRGTIVLIESSLEQGGKAFVSSYSYAKQLLPQDFQDALRSSEEISEKVLHPIESSLHQAYVGLKGIGESLGVDIDDPLIQFIIVFGFSATLWGAYRVLIYGGYSGDLSPQSTFELLQGNENAVLVDIRSEDVRERDGIPDLRRKARFRYASIAIPEVDGSVRKLLKGGRELEDSLLAAIIRNLKIADDRSKVLVLDLDGSRAKGVARSLRKLGTKRTYLVKGGFQSWVQDGFRIKMLKPETLLTVLNEETEAIIEEIKPTPLKIVGFGVGVLAIALSLLEWEKTLQIVGVIGLGQSIYRRVTSYEDAEDFKQDLRLLVTPVKLGVDAISRATGTMENGRNGLTTSPRSSSDVQNRVLQAAAKHELQPEETQDMYSSNENMNASDA